MRSMTHEEWLACDSIVASVMGFGNRKMTGLLIEGALFRAALAGKLDTRDDSVKEKLRSYFNFAMMLRRSGMFDEAR